MNMEMKKTEEILNNKDLIPEAKVYLIAEEIINSGHSIHDHLWQAIMEMKGKRFPEVPFTMEELKMFKPMN